jgi:putative acetyltransferase
VTIRPEHEADADAIRAVHEASFPAPGESRLVDALRSAGRLVVSLVAEVDGRGVGHVAFSPVTLAATASTAGPGLGLGPLSVLPEFRRRGIGARLVTDGMGAAAAAAATFVVVLGDPAYYGRFGFAPAARWGLTDAYGGGDAFQAIELRPGALAGAAGLVRYAPKFAIVT